MLQLFVTIFLPQCFVACTRELQQQKSCWENYAPVLRLNQRTDGSCDLPPDPCPEKKKKKKRICEKGGVLACVRVRKTHMNVRLVLHLHFNFITIPLSSSQAARSNPYAAKRAYDASRQLGAVVGGVTLSVKTQRPYKRPKNISSLTGTSGRA